MCIIRNNVTGKFFGIVTIVSRGKARGRGNNKQCLLVSTTSLSKSSVPVVRRESVR